jgi:hypothetical protein
VSRSRLQREIALPGAPADRLAVATLAALVLLLFRPAVFGGQALFIRDISMVWYPQIESFVRCVAAGSPPLWDMYRGFGQPMLADPSTQVLYPPTWLNLVMSPWHYYTFFAVSHLVASAWGVYLLARRWGCSRGAAFVAGAVWSLSGPLLSFVSLWHHFAGAAWIPWVFLASDVALTTGRTSHAVAWGAVTALQILAGSADMVAITGLALLAYALAHHVRWRPPRKQTNRRLASQGLIAALVALGLSAALWLPAAAFARGSLRAHLPAAERVIWSLHPAGLLGLICLIHWGDAPLLVKDAAAQRDLQGPFLFSLYLGGPAAALAAAALVGRARRSVTLACLALGALLVALGRYAGVYDAAVTLLPPLRIFRFPVKWVILAALAWSLLAGIGYDVWRTAKHWDLRWMLGVVSPIALFAAALTAGSLALEGRPGMAPLAGALLTGAGLFAAAALLALARCFGGRIGWAAAPAIAVLVVGELAVRQQDIQLFAPRRLFTHRPEVLEVLRDLADARLYVYDYSVAAYPGQERGRDAWGYRLAGAPLDFSPRAALVLGVQMYLNPPTAGRWGLFGSYDLDLLGLAPEPLARLTEYLRRAEGRPSHVRLLRMGGVRYVLALHRERWWDDLAPVAALPGLFTEPIQVLRVPDPLPRAYLVGGVRIADGEPAFSLLEDPGFDPSRELILAGGTPRQPPASFAGSSRITRLEPDRVEIEAELAEAGYLVLLDAYDAGWRASVDGQSVALQRANIAFRAVALPAGRHQVELVYRPSAVTYGLLASAATMLVAGGVVLSRRRVYATTGSADAGSGSSVTTR